MSERTWDFETVAAQAGSRMRVGSTISTVAPIDASTTFTGDSIDEVHAALEPETDAYAYSRNANPTVANLERVLAALESADATVAFGSGMAAIQATLAAQDLGPGDVIVAASALYGATRTLFAQLGSTGIETRYIDILNLSEVETALADSDVRLLYFESIANPLLQVADVGRLAGVARRRRVTSIIDNTFATPYLLRPLELGVDIVVHSATKYIAGHGDVMAGVVACQRSWAERIRLRRTQTGAVLSPFEAWLTLRGVRTLPLRMARQCETAERIAGWLVSQPWVERVYYPGLADNPGHDLAAHQFDARFGGMVAFDLRAARDQTLRFMDALELINPGTSLGDVGSLILYPALASHRGLSPEERAQVGIGDGLLRLSVGLESSSDLIADLAEAALDCGLADQSEIAAPDLART